MNAVIETPSTDYARVERAIRWIEENRLDQPTLEQVADAMCLSPFHAHRVFTRWVGVSPKRFLGLLTVEHAKCLLRHASSVLETTYQVGLSGPGRLHDLFVTYEALTPGEYKAMGSGLTLRWGVHPTPFGDALLVVSDRGIARLAFMNGGGIDTALKEAFSAWPLSRFERDQLGTAAWMRRCFPDDPRKEPLPLLIKGTLFQIQVWRAMLSVPEGSTVSYGDIAAAIGRPSAARAVGAALRANRLGYIVPCHRVIRETGAVGGYQWGVPRKHAMLAWEATRRAALAEAA
jgi:AraC family transcriptional regulator of adaptative response/methylated-DNA-[protein]-cysteine methyltransferase